MGCSTALSYFRLVNGNCIGAFVASTTFANVTSLDICGPTLLDHSNGTTFVSHPMIGALRLTEVLLTFFYSLLTFLNHLSRFFLHWMGL